MKSFFAYDMFAFMGVPSPLVSYAFVTVNGEDHGLFLVTEEPEESFAMRNFGTDHGLLYKPEFSGEDENAQASALEYIGDEPEKYEDIFREAKFDITEDDKTRLINSLKTLSGHGELTDAVNVDEVLRYFAVHSFLVNLDSYFGPRCRNYFLYEDDGILSMPPWDYNLAYGTYPNETTITPRTATYYINYPIDTPFFRTNMIIRPMYGNVVGAENNEDIYHEYLTELATEYYESGHFEALFIETFEMIEPYVKKDPSAYCSYDDFLKGAETLKEFCILRAQSVRGQAMGTIPSTDTEQEEDCSALIKASHINIADLGGLGGFEK